MVPLTVKDTFGSRQYLKIPGVRHFRIVSLKEVGANVCRTASNEKSNLNEKNLLDSFCIESMRGPAGVTDMRCVNDPHRTGSVALQSCACTTPPWA
jgi:hypothetical protein